jgi:hypothetical protein
MMVPRRKGTSILVRWRAWLNLRSVVRRPVASKPQRRISGTFMSKVLSAQKNRNGSNMSGLNCHLVMCGEERDTRRSGECAVCSKY